MWRILLVLFKSAIAVALFEFLHPVAEAVGVQLTFVGTAAAAISQAAHIPYQEAEILFLLAVAVTLSQVARVVWELITGWGI
jgi:hypothetical protein